ncbi:hypothetical protein [Streptosporangium carneum]
MLKTVGDRMLTMAAPHVEAAADPTYVECYCNNLCALFQRVCGPGGCTAWTLIGGCIKPTGPYPC